MLSHEQRRKKFKIPNPLSIRHLINDIQDSPTLIINVCNIFGAFHDGNIFIT